MTEQKRYYVTIDQTGHGEGFAVCTPDHRQMAYLSFDEDDPASEEAAENDAQLIVDALNAFSVARTPVA